MFRKFVFPAYARVTGNRHSTRQSSERGQLVLAAALVCGAISIDTDLTLNYQLFSLLIILLISSRITVKFHQPEVTVKRVLPRYASANQKFSYDILITNIGERVEADLKIVDEPVIVQPGFDEFQASREPFEETRNIYDRFIGWHRFLWLQRVKTGIRLTPALASEVPVKSQVRVKIEAEPLRRGFTKFGTTAVLHPDLLGLNYGVKRFKNPERLLILPERYRISESFELPGGSNALPGGTNASWSTGNSDEFVSLRDYREGDSAKKIHWPSSMKRQKPVVREYQDEYFLRQSLILDISTNNLTLVEESVSVATSFLFRMTEKNASVDLVYCAESPTTISGGSSSGTSSAAGGQGRQLEALATIKPNTQPFSTLAEYARTQAQGLTGCVIVSSQWTEQHQQLQRLFESKGVPTTAFIIVTTEDLQHISTNHCHYLTSGKVQEALLGL
jgi:uncharacterized protein (DUF58 family)